MKYGPGASTAINPAAQQNSYSRACMTVTVSIEFSRVFASAGIVLKKSL
jgi:hypothetical protein